MRLSVVVCTWNRSRMLRRALDEMRRLLVPQDLQWELLIVNNNCADDTDHVVAEFGDALPLRLVHEARPGLSHARNRAIDEAAGEYLIFADDDVLVDARWLGAYAEAVARWPDAAVFGGPIAPHFDERPPRWLAQVLPRVGGIYGLLDLGSEPRPLSIEGLVMPFGGNFAIRATELRRHRFDTALGRRPQDVTAVGEDVELIEAVISAGATGWWVPDARVRHCLGSDVLRIRALRRRLTGHGTYLGWRALARGERERLGSDGELRRRMKRAELHYVSHRLAVRPEKWIEDLVEACETRGLLRALAAFPAADDGARDRARAEDSGPPARRPSTLRIASWPHWYAPNRVLDLMYAALEPFGIEHAKHVRLGPDLWRDDSTAVHAVHLHWVEPYWREPNRSAGRQLMRIARLASIITRARRRGIRVLWSVHNLEHLDGARVVDRLGYRLLHRLADVRLFTSEWARRVAVHRYGGAERTLVVPHGSYDGLRPVSRTRDETLARAGIPGTRRLLLCFGDVREYKGVDVAMAAMRFLPRDAFHLLIAGRAGGTYGRAIATAAEERQDLTVRLGEVEEQFLIDLIAASELVLLPYRRVTGSGALLHALTSGRAVVASDLPYFREMLGAAPEAGTLVPSDDPSALAAGIVHLVRVPARVREDAALRLAREWSWPKVILPLADWLRAGPPE